MHIRVLTLFPQLYDSFLKTSIVGKSLINEKCSIKIDSLINYKDNNKKIDSPIVGHGNGMLIGPEIIERSLENSENTKPSFKIFFSPHGKKLNQHLLHDLYNKIIKSENNVTLICGRYEGIDARAEEHYADEIISIGDYVLMGGDLPAMVFIEALLRLIPNIIKESQSVEDDSFEGPFLDTPHFTGLPSWKDKLIPPILKSGHHKEIYNWRRKQAINRTLYYNFEWLKKHRFTQKEKQEIFTEIPPHYCVLMHNDVVLPDNTIGTSSVTSIDIHDIARSAKTYGIKEYFIVTKLEAQQEIVKGFLSFWHEGKGSLIEKNQRRDAIKQVSLEQNLENVINLIIEREKIKPLVIATSSKWTIAHERFITYHDQGILWKAKKPILLVFGTAHGLSKEIMDKCDFRLIPLEGFSDFNFLSVRSAVAIILDRWLGINSKYIENKENT
jgi:tRNA (guanine37-N1)-methyltransferase